MLKDVGPSDTTNIQPSVAKDPSSTKEDDQCNEAVNSAINVDDLPYDDELILNVNPGIAKRLRTRKGKVVHDTTPPKQSKKKTVVGPPKYWSKVDVSAKKRKVRPDTES